MSEPASIYLVIDPAGIFKATPDLDSARRVAEDISGILAAVPILEDYRPAPPDA
jgi:hypothetical protein